MAHKKDATTDREKYLFIIAILGCLLGIFNTSWTIWTNYQSNSKRVSLGYKIGSDLTGKTSTLVVTVINNGATPITVWKLYVSSNDNDGSYVIFPLEQDVAASVKIANGISLGQANILPMHPYHDKGEPIPTSGLVSYVSDHIPNYCWLTMAKSNKVNLKLTVVLSDETKYEKKIELKDYAEDFNIK